MKNILSLFVDCLTKDEDAGYKDHMVGQTEGPFYCGTAFCGHATKKAARECWKRKCSAIERIRAEVKRLRAEGQNEEAEKVERGIVAYYPEQNPANWPINRTRADIQHEFLERAKRELAS